MQRAKERFNNKALSLVHSVDTVQLLLDSAKTRGPSRSAVAGPAAEQKHGDPLLGGSGGKASHKRTHTEDVMLLNHLTKPLPKALTVPLVVLSCFPRSAHHVLRDMSYALLNYRTQLTIFHPVVWSHPLTGQFHAM